MIKSGKLFIFNLKKCDNNKLSDNKTESSIYNESEIKSLVATFQKFNAEISIFDQLSKEKLIESLTKIERQDLDKYKYVAVAVLLHHQNENYGPEMFYFHNEIIIAFLKNLTIKNKPKIFVVQACRSNFDIFDMNPMGRTRTTDYNNPKMLLCYAARPYGADYKDKYATYFVEMFCKNLEDHGLTEPVQRIMKRTIKAVQLETSDTQIPSYLDHADGDLILGNFLS